MLKSKPGFKIEEQNGGKKKFEDTIERQQQTAVFHLDQLKTTVYFARSGTKRFVNKKCFKSNRK